MQKPGLTSEIADWIAARPAPGADDSGTAARGVADCVAVMHAGWADSAAADLRRIDGLERWDSPLAPPRAAPGLLALHLACAAHALDFDDTAFGAHPSAVLVPVLLAEAAAHPADGARLIAAYLAGYETWAELSAREPSSVHGKGWHPSAVYGPAGATAALCAFRGHDAATCRTALSLAASMSGGVVAQFGTMAKPWQLGRAASAAFEAARLAEAGMQAAPDALEHPLGFLTAVSPGGEPRRDGASDLGGHMARNGLNIKRYPVCYALHRVLDGLEQLTPGLTADAVQRIDIEIGTAQAAMLRHDCPDTPAQAKFSLPFATAAMLLRGRLGVAELDPGFIRSDAVRAIYPRVHVTTVDGRQEIEPSLAPFDRVTLHTTGGARDSGPIALPLGHAGNPAPAEAVDRKIADCLAAGPHPDDAARLMALLRDLPGLPDTTTLIAHRQEDPVA